MSNLKIIVTRRWPENVMQVKLEHLSNLELEYRQRGFIMMIKVRLLISTYLLKAYFETLRCTSAKL